VRRELVVQEGGWVTGCLGWLLVCLKGVLAVLEPLLRAFGKASHCMDTNVNGQRLRIVGKLSVVVLEHFQGRAVIAIVA